VLFSLHVIIAVGSKNDVGQAFSPSASPTGWGGFMFGIVYAVLMYTGFETAANLAEETENPKRDIPRAAIASVVVVMVVYMICSYAQVAGFGFDLNAMGKNAAAPLFALAAPSEAGGYGGVAIGRLLELVVVLDMFAVLIGCTVASSRGLFAMARDGRLPKPMAKVSGRGTPLNAAVLVLVFYALWIFVTRQFTHLFAIPGFPHYFAMFSWGAAFGGLALATIYFLVSLGALRGLKGHEKPALVWLAALAGMAVTALGIFGAFYQVPQPSLGAAYAVVTVLVIGLILAVLTRGTSISHHDFHEFTDLAGSEQGPQKL
jgi:amino acid transporter